MTATSPRYRTDSIYYTKSDYLTPPPSTIATRTPTPKMHIYSVFSPPELVHDEEEEEEEEDQTPIPASPPSTPPSCLDMNQQQQTHRKPYLAYSCDSSNKRQKCTPHRSPLTTHAKNDRIFTWPSHPPLPLTIHLKHQQNQQKDQHKEPQPRIIFLRHRSARGTVSDSTRATLSPPAKNLDPPQRLDSPQQPLPITTVHPPPTLSIKPSVLSIKSPSPIDHTHGAFSSGRPIRTKGPCQACHESSEACMRKAFDWPFPSDEVYYDKGRSFVYLCNKCGLRYNKSGGSVCRNCRWVLCKEEKRKVVQLVETMQSSGQVSLDDDIASFVCTPKYWHCGQPWKVRWIMNLVADPH